MKVPIAVDGHLRGEENMRRDLAMLDAGELAVRLYGWRPAAASIGRSQTAEAVDGAAAREFGVNIVERPTGGGAILHNEQEVTYAVVCPTTLGSLPRDIPGSFAFLSDGVRRGLISLGLDVEVQSAPGRAAEDLCYLRHQGTNLFVGGRKISGGAQRRTPKAILQHGTVIVERDEERMARLFRSDVAEIRSKVTSLHEEGYRPTRAEIVAALLAGFEQAFEQAVADA
ncbi:MAG: lipoate--protein ligase family protein [Thermoplasmatota archaeon]